MKKTGFTLAELLISLGIVGVIAAITLPLIGKITPDTNKVMYLKAHDALQETVLALASDSTVFAKNFQIDSETKLDIKKYPLLDTTASQNSNYGHHAGATKLCKLLAESIGSGSNNCSASNYNFNEANFNNTFKNNTSFVSSNGTQWWIVPKANAITPTVNEDDGSIAYNMMYQTDVYVDVNNSSGSKNCIYNKDSCKTPDRFKFMITASGQVIPADPMGDFYNTHRLKYTKKAEKINDDSIVNVLDFTLYTANIPTLSGIE